jgi:cytochrome c5
MQMRATLLVLLIGMLFMGACAPTPAATATPAEEPAPGAGPDGQALLQDRCTVCHSLSRVEQAGKTAAEWENSVNRMVGYGAVLSAEELDVLIQFLAETYP